MLHMPVYQLAEMPHDELLGWFAYLEKRPLGWREDDRAAKIIQSAGVKEKSWNLFPSLDRIYHPGKFGNDPENPLSTLKGSALFTKLLSAQGGDTISL
jgi:hypothetical protein